MPNIKALKLEVQNVESLKLITESLSEVAAIKFKTTKSEIQHNKVFFKDISNVYRAVELLSEKRRLMEHRSQAKNGRTISLLITSNYPLYGGIDSKLSSNFKEAVRKYPTERIVIGVTGNTYLQALDPNGRYERFVMKKDIPNNEELQALTQRIKDYSRVFVYHSKFVTILDQSIEVTDLSSGQGQTDQLSKIEFILEPKLSKMLDFFESQIVSSILVSIFLQAQLSRTAARMIGMDQAELNTEKILTKQRLAVVRTKRKLQNLRILEMFPIIEAITEGQNG